MSRFGPKAQLAAVTHHWGEYYTSVARSVLDGAWKPGSLWGGMKEDMIRIEAFNEAVPKAVVDEVGARAAAIRVGEFHPFTGPIAASDGRQVAAAGAVLSDEQLGAMDFYVQGVVGKVPSAAR
jgi:simple sugar transport system substrate-binding protein